MAKPQRLEDIKFGSATHLLALTQAVIDLLDDSNDPAAAVRKGHLVAILRAALERRPKYETLTLRRH